MHFQLPEKGEQKNGLLFARVACIVVSALVLGLFIITLPTYFTKLHLYCSDSCIYGQLSVSNIQSLHRLEMSLNTYAILFVALLIVSALLCVAVATLLLWRRPDNWIALLVAFLLVVLGVRLYHHRCLRTPAITWTRACIVPCELLKFLRCRLSSSSLLSLSQWPLCSSLDSLGVDRFDPSVNHISFCSAHYVRS